MSPPPNDPGRSPGAILEDVAAAVVMADAADADSLRQLARICDELATSFRRDSDRAMREVVEACAEALRRAEADPVQAAPALQLASDTVTRLQGLLARPGAREAPRAPDRVERDADTVSLFGDFLQESAEGISRADQILMAVEEQGATAEHVNSLFRVFHTIKGTAGFLDLADVVELAHTTETMLNRCRQGELKLEGEPTDLCLEATTVMRTMLDGVKSAVEQSLPFTRAADLSGLLARIVAATEGAGPSADGPAAPASS